MAAETILYSFTRTGTDGGVPKAGLTLDANGDLFGTTFNGGTADAGTVFEIKAGATTATTLYSFTGNGTDGALPDASLTLDANGDLFGTTQQGGSDNDGTVFEIKAGATTATTLYSFTGTGTDGNAPLAGLTLDANGDLFGTTNLGGSDNDGTVFEIKAGATTATTLYSFTGVDGAQPAAGLILNANGDLFGTTKADGPGDAGTVFEIKAGATTVTTLSSFTGANGENPGAGLIFDGNGDLFGTTEGGGTGFGTVFELKAGAKTVTTLYSFTGTGTDGAVPDAGVIRDADGDLFGTTREGGSNGVGTVFELKAGATTATTLYSFTDNGTDGFLPQAGLTVDSNGDLFGTTVLGGSDGDGTVFEITDSGFVVCFVAGTRIATPSGEVPVERLAIGDMVHTGPSSVFHEQPIKWIGWRRINLRAHPRPELVAPVRIRRAAFADNIPHRDLLLSPDHAIFVEGKLICARQLINGTTISQDGNLAVVEYFHVELDQHAILRAEGLPTESYLDTGNRGFFANSGSPPILHPDLTDEADCPTREATSCAPFVWHEDAVHPVWERLTERAIALGQPAPTPQTTTDPELRIVVRGRTLRPISIADGCHRFVVPKGETAVRVVSRAASPTDARPWMEDRRRLGVYVERIVLRGDDLREIPIDHPALSQGWWNIERNGIELRRWTDGDAILPLPATDGPTILEIRASNSGMAYLVSADQPGLAA